MSFNLRILSLTLHCTPHISCIAYAAVVCVIYSLMHSHDVNDSTYFTIVEINGSQTLWHHHPECSWKHLISWKDCSASSLLFALVIPSSHPHLNKKKCSEKENGEKEKPSPRRNCHSNEMNTEIFRGGFMSLTVQCSADCSTPSSWSQWVLPPWNQPSPALLLA